MITTVIFDFGGVLLNWDPRNLYRRFFTSTAEMEDFLTEIDFSTWNVHQDRGRPFEEGVRELSTRFPHRAGLIRAYHEHWEESVGRPIEGTIEILKKVKQGGYSVFGLSNWSAETFPRALAKYDFFDLLDGYMLSGEVRSVKPDHLIFKLALEKFHRQSRECIFIDDSSANIAAAASMGFICIHFQNPRKLAEELEHLGILKRNA